PPTSTNGQPRGNPGGAKPRAYGDLRSLRQPGHRIEEMAMQHTAGGRQLTLRGVRALLGMLAVVGGLTLFLPSGPLAEAAPPATAAASVDTGTEGAFVAALNDIRQSHGVAPLQIDDRLVGIARDWSDQMAAAGSISHNPSLTAVSAPWCKLGEN